jgi:hypothetical protein
MSDSANSAGSQASVPVVKSWFWKGTNVPYSCMGMTAAVLIGGTFLATRFFLGGGGQSEIIVSD